MRFFLFGTSGCHLCEQAEAMIKLCLAESSQVIFIESIDIAEQQQWQKQYAIRIPVLYHPESGRELAWPFDENAVNNFIASF